jgi:hypothetical protein
MGALLLNLLYLHLLLIDLFTILKPLKLQVRMPLAGSFAAYHGGINLFFESDEGLRIVLLLLLLLCKLGVDIEDFARELVVLIYQKLETLR